MFRRSMFGKALIGFVLASALTFTAMAAEVVVRIGPPHAVVERRPPAPSRGHVWISGYHNWDGHTHVWVPGRWELAPRPHAKWVAHHWEHRRNGYVLVEGHWR